MNLEESLVHKIKSVIPDAKVLVQDLTGTRDHYNLTVVSDFFKQKTTLERHRLVMDVLKDDLKNELHAVQIKTLTYDKFEQSQNQ